jgi:hypothetical protein
LTTRERWIAAARGGEVDRKPVLCWPSAEAGDIVIATSEQQVRDAANADRPVLIQTSNPFGIAKANGVLLNSAFAKDVAEGDALLGRFTAECRATIESGLAAGADGVFFVVHGARGSESTPMEFGGHYLEVDREILADYQDASLNIVYVVGNDDLYLDFVSDLPAHVFAWDSEASTFDSAYVRTLRTGAQASADPASEIELKTGVQSVADFFTNAPARADHQQAHAV